MREKHVVLQHAPNRKERLNFSQPSSPPFFPQIIINLKNFYFWAWKRWF